MDWKERVLDEVRNAYADVTALMVNADSNEVMLEYNADARVVSASTIKVAIMLCALDAVKKGELSLDQHIQVSDSDILEDSEVFEYGAQEMQLGDLIRWMIITSDNTATNVLIRLLTMPRINAYCRQIGLKNTCVERVMLDFDAVEKGLNNYTSAQDQCRMFLMIAHKTILDEQLCVWAMDALLGQRYKDDFMRYIPDRVKVAHKTGSLDNLDHDSALFFLDSIRFYLGVFVSNAPDNGYAQRLLGRIGKCVYDEWK